ncbi:hypothetical protein [Aquabacter spiritensis]|uniref:Uncharacterized protein n=1 Tax=Aquabacter spiritensis TaxID=933073 RepID=A0A4R3LQC9_9HYPH|nr:hypothetical protein [Aquabacter spiritensis]TCT02703.1 hypothetical protein EDC64_112142 [Aquabacter spiritensis]
MSLASYLSALDLAAQEAEAAERTFRAEADARSKALAAARAEAYRRVNFLRPLAGVIGGADPEDAVRRGSAYLRDRLGWTEDTPARVEVLAHFAPVATAIHYALADAPAGDEITDPAAAMATFETWYLETRETPFWYLFEHYMPETPLVDF